MNDIITIGIERQYCCKSSEYYKIEVEEYVLRDEYLNSFNNGIVIKLCEGNYMTEEDCILSFYFNNTKFIKIDKEEYININAKVLDIIC